MIGPILSYSYLNGPPPEQQLSLDERLLLFERKFDEEICRVHERAALSERLMLEKMSELEIMLRKLSGA